MDVTAAGGRSVAAERIDGVAVTGDAATVNQSGNQLNVYLQSAPPLAADPAVPAPRAAEVWPRVWNVDGRAPAGPQAHGGGRRQALGDQHPEAMWSAVLLAEMPVSDRRAALARPLAVEALRCLQSLLDPDHPRVRRAREVRDRVAAAMGGKALKKRR